MKFYSKESCERGKGRGCGCGRGGNRERGRDHKKKSVELSTNIDDSNSIQKSVEHTEHTKGHEIMSSKPSTLITRLGKIIQISFFKGDINDSNSVYEGEKGVLQISSDDDLVSEESNK